MLLGTEGEKTDEGQSEKDREERKSKSRGSTEMSGKKLRESPNHRGDYEEEPVD